MRYAHLFLLALAFAMVGCNHTRNTEDGVEDANSTLEVRQTFIAKCDEVTTITILANDGNVSVDENNTYSTNGAMDISLNVVVDCLDPVLCEDCNATCDIIDDNETEEGVEDGTD